MNLMQFLNILKARYKVVLITFAVIVIGTLLISLVWPKKYSATADVLVDVKIVDPLSGAMTVSPMMAGFMATQMDIIKSQRVAIRAIKLLKIDKNPQAVAQWNEATEGRGNLEGWLADRFRGALDVKPGRESNVVSISYAWADPKFASVMANAFAQAYADTTLDLRVEPAKQSAGWFDERSQMLREQLEKAQTKLSDYQRKHGIVANDERIDAESARLAELSSQLTVAQSQKVEAESKERQANGNVETSPDIMQSPVIQSLRADLAREEGSLGEMSAQLGKNHPQFKRKMAEIVTLRLKLATEMEKVQASMGASSAVTRQREAGMRAALAAQKQRVLDLKGQRDEIAVLQRDVEMAQKAYDAVSQRFTQTNLESQLNQTNVIILNPALEPLEASSPRVMRNLLIACFLGPMLGIGLAFALELLDQKVYGANDLDSEAVGMPLLGVLKPARTRNTRWERLLSRIKPRRFRFGGLVAQ